MDLLRLPGAISCLNLQFEAQLSLMHNATIVNQNFKAADHANILIEMSVCYFDMYAYTLRIYIPKSRQKLAFKYTLLLSKEYFERMELLPNVQRNAPNLHKKLQKKSLSSVLQNYTWKQRTGKNICGVTSVLLSGGVEQLNSVLEH